MSIKVSRIISMVFNPALVLVWMVFSLILGEGPQSLLSAFILLLVGIGPILFLEMKFYLTSAKNEFEPGRMERDGMYLVGIFAFSVSSILFGTSAFNDVLWFNLSMILAIYFALAYLVNRYFDKISMHTAMFTFTSVLLAGRVDYGLMLLLVLLPLIIWARLDLHKHDWVEIMWGLAVGLIVGLLSWLF